MRTAFIKEGERTGKDGSKYVCVTFVKACDLAEPEDTNVYFATYKVPGKKGLKTDHSMMIPEGMYKNLLSVSNTEGDTGRYVGVADVDVFMGKKKTFALSPSGKTYTEEKDVLMPAISAKDVTKYTVPDVPFDDAAHRANYHAAMQRRKRPVPDVTDKQTDTQMQAEGMGT